jgi:hypothetical protein
MDLKTILNLIGRQNGENNLSNSFDGLTRLVFLTNRLSMAVDPGAVTWPKILHVRSLLMAPTTMASCHRISERTNFARRYVGIVSAYSESFSALFIVFAAKTSTVDVDLFNKG